VPGILDLDSDDSEYFESNKAKALIKKTEYRTSEKRLERPSSNSAAIIKFGSTLINWVDSMSVSGTLTSLQDYSAI
jgi:hypothetical protein